jgi:folate-binding protein YgfZ
MFLMRSKATIDRVDDTLVRLGAWGPAAEAVATRLVGSLPDAPFRQVTADGVTVLRLPGETPRVELVLPTDRAVETWRNLEAASAVACIGAAWRLLDIRSGIGWIHAETTENFIPQMLNYDRIGGISFTKGCYVGQEVVARLHHLGEVKRRAYLGTLNLAEPPPPGTPLVSPESSSRQGAGTVVDAVVTASGECELLAVVERKAQAAGNLRLETPDGPVVRLHEPPYALADPEQVQAPA